VTTGRHETDPLDKGVNYGEVEPVLMDADIYGWALMAKEGRLGDVKGRASKRRPMAWNAPCVRFPLMPVRTTSASFASRDSRYVHVDRARSPVEFRFGKV